MKNRVSSPALVLALFLLPACGPTLREITAGRVGCPPEDIEIQKGHTRYVWTATCHGKTYYCSRSGGTVSGVVYGPHGVVPYVGSTVGEAACKSGEENEGAPSEARPAVAAAKKKTELPKGAGGFVFGSARADVSKLCTDAGKAWTEPESDRAECAGTAVETGFTATSRLTFCDDALCGVTLLVSLENVDRTQWAQQYPKIRDSLADKYGAPASRAEDVPTVCTTTGVGQCLSRGVMTLESRWSWAEPRSSIRLVLGQIEGAVGIGIVYRGTREAPKPNSDAL